VVGAGLAAAAAKTLFVRTVLRLGVARGRPPRRSRGFEPLGIAVYSWSGSARLAVLFIGELERLTQPNSPKLVNGQLLLVMCLFATWSLLDCYFDFGQTS
jgi:hypothetical protein